MLSPQARYFLLCRQKKVSKEKATLAAAKARSKKCVQGDSATRSSLTLLAQTLLVLKPWPPIFERLAAKGVGAVVGLICKLSLLALQPSSGYCILGTCH